MRSVGQFVTAVIDVGPEFMEAQATKAEAWADEAAKPRLTGVGWAGVAMLVAASGWWALRRHQKS